MSRAGSSLAFPNGTSSAVHPGHSLAVVSHPSSTDSMAVTRDLVPSVSLPKRKSLRTEGLPAHPLASTWFLLSPSEVRAWSRR